MALPSWSTIVRNRSVWKAWIPALLWLAVITVESTSLLSSEHTGQILYPLFHFLFKIDPFRFFIWHFYLRKMGHVLGYGILSLLLFRAWRATITVPGFPPWSVVWARSAVFMTALVASLDEWHQTFLPSRTGSVRDVVLDSSAALAAQVLLFLLMRGWRSHTPDDPSGNPSSPPNASPRTCTPVET